MKKFSCLLTLIAVLMLLVPLGVSAQENEIMIADCEAVSGWYGGVSLDTNEFTQGSASITQTVDFSSGTGAFVIYRPFAPMDLSEANTVRFDLYVTYPDFSGWAVDGCFELTSGGTWDKEEIGWGRDVFSSINLTEGWNTVSLPIPDLSESDFDITACDFIRFYMVGMNDCTVDGKAFVIKLDNFRALYVDYSAVTDAATDPEEDPPDNPGDIDFRPAESDTDPVATETGDVGTGGKSPAAAILLIAAAVIAAVAGILLISRKRTLIGVILLVACAGALIIGIIMLTSSGGTAGGDPVDGETETPSDETPVVAEIVFSETPVATGMSYKTVTEEKLEYMEIAGTGCWLFENERNMDKNEAYFSIDPALKSYFENNITVLDFYVYFVQETSFTVRYINSEGNEATAFSEIKNADRGWMTIRVQLDRPQLNGGIDGYDFHVTMGGDWLIRVGRVSVKTSSRMHKLGTAIYTSELMEGEIFVSSADVVCFGAVGDGVTDDTVAFKNAINFVTGIGGGTVFVPLGNYLLTEPLDLPAGVSLVGELRRGTSEGTRLLIGHGAGQTDSPAVRMMHQSCVKNICFWYPDQTFTDGSPVVYSPTVLQVGVESITLDNIYFVNSYAGIDCATGGTNISLQHIKDIYGCCLTFGYYNDMSYDIGRIENLNFGADYWLDSGVENLPEEEVLRTWLIRNAIGLHLQRIDWTYIADITVEGYMMGILADKSDNGTSNGHLYRVKIIDCYYGLTAEECSWFLMTDCDISAYGGNSAAAIYCSAKNSGTLSINNCRLVSAGTSAVINKGAGFISFGDCVLESAHEEKTFSNLKNGDYTAVNTTFGGKDVGIKTDAPKTGIAVNYEPEIPLYPASEAFVDITAEPYSAKQNEDITERLQSALNSFGADGGTVYIPGGIYNISASITIPAGVELRGCQEAANKGNTALVTDFGLDDPDGQALINMSAGSGMRGLAVVYPAQRVGAIRPCSFTVRGNGENIYLINIHLPTSYNGVDFETNRCDKHYIQYIWGCPLNMGIQVGGGSEDGIVRDVHYTPNCFGGNWETAYQSVMTRGVAFRIGETKNQVMYHNFTYGAFKGIWIDEGCRDAVIICHGTDSGNYAAYFSGDCTATLIDSQLVNLPAAGIDNNYQIYFYTDETFSGKLDVINSAYWGLTKDSICLDGDGEVNFYQGIMLSSGTRTVTANDGTCSYIGMYGASSAVKYDLYAENGAAIRSAGSFYQSGGKFFGKDVTGPDTEK